MSILCSTAVGCKSSLESTLAGIHEAGFKYIDLLVIDGWVHVNPRDLADDWDKTVGYVERLFEKYHLTPLAINSGVSVQLHDRSAEANTQRIREINALIRFMKHSDIKVAAIQPGSMDHNRPWEDVLADCVKTLKEQKAAGDAAGVTFALEFHINSPIGTMDQVRRFMEVMPEMPVVYDPSHFIMQGMDIHETEWLVKKAAHIHIRDAARNKIQVDMGKGAVDFHWMLDTLKRNGYQGHFSIEYLEEEGVDVYSSAVNLWNVINGYFS